MGVTVLFMVSETIAASINYECKVMLMSKVLLVQNCPGDFCIFFSVLDWVFSVG